MMELILMMLPLFGFHHRAHHQLGHIVYALQVHVHHLIPLFWAHTQQQVIFRDAGIVHANIHRTKFFQHIRSPALRILQIRLHYFYRLLLSRLFAISFSFQGFCFFIRAYVRKRNIGSFICKFQRDRFSDPRLAPVTMATLLLSNFIFNR